MFAKLHVEWRCEYLKDEWNPFGENREFKDLTVRQKLELLYRLCHWRLELDDVSDQLRVRREGERKRERWAFVRIRWRMCGLSI